MAKSNIVARNIQKLMPLRHLGHNCVQNVWTRENVVMSPFKEIQEPSMTVTDYVWRNLDKWADKPAVVCGITNRSFTYHELYKYSRKFALKLRSQLGLREGDVACVVMPNNPEYALATLGALEAGAAVTTVNPIYTAHEVHSQLLLSNAKVVICTSDTVGVVREACKMAKRNLPLIAVTAPGEPLPPGTLSFHEILNGNNEDFSILKSIKRNVDDIALLPYSSGTTGLPKGVELVHRTIVTNLAQQSADGIRHCQFATDSQQESLMAALPFYHMYGLSVILLHKLTVGGRIVTLPKFETKTFLNAIKEHKTSVLHIVPPLASFLGCHPEAKPEYLSNIHTFVCGAAPIPKQDILRILEKAKPDVDFLQIYGLTEMSPIACSPPGGEGLEGLATVGVALPNTRLRVVDTEGTNLGPNWVGELLIKGPQMMKGYRNNAEATKAVITEDGWFRSGDLASIDRGGVVTICDRIKELIKVKGFQVAPAELENVLKEHPDVLDAAVIGVPDFKMGEVPKAFVVVKDGRRKDSANLKTFVEHRVASYKRISHIEFLANIPRNPSGKILRKVLRESYA